MQQLPFLRSQRNAIFQAIERAELNPSDFTWERRDYDEMQGIVGPRTGSPAPVLVHRPTGSYFVFGVVHAKYSPGKDDAEAEDFVFDWDQRLTKVREWLKYVKRETAPDLWESIALTPDAAGIPHTPFTLAEQKAVLQRLAEINERIAALDALTREQKELLSGELRCIGDASRRMDRAEWLRFAIGSLVTVLMSADIQRSVAASVMRWVASAFHSIVTGSPVPLLPFP
jgi:hypothetical protein